LLFASINDSLIKRRYGVIGIDNKNDSFHSLKERINKEFGKKWA
jgi:hypothetical protein